MTYAHIYLLLTGSNDTHYKRVQTFVDHYDPANQSDTLLVISGNSHLRPQPQGSEAQQYADYLRQHGTKLPEVVLETQALDTLGNMIYSHPLITPHLGPDSTVYLLTDRYHMPRSRWLFAQVFAGVKVQTLTSAANNWVD